MVSGAKPTPTHGRGPGRIGRESLNYLRQAAVDIDAQLKPEKYNRGAHLLVF